MGTHVDSCIKTYSYFFLQKVKNLEVDLNYVSQHARSIVDIVFVMDVSGSIDNNEFEESKVFFKNLLEYFSIAQGHGQVSNQI